MTFDVPTAPSRATRSPALAVTALAMALCLSGCGKSESLRSEETAKKPAQPTATQPASNSARDTENSAAPGAEKADQKSMMTQAELLEKARKHLADKAGIDAALVATLDVNYRLLLDESGTNLGAEPDAKVPFVFFQTRPKGNPRQGKGQPTPVYALGADAATGTVYYKDEAGFAAFARAYGIADAPDKLAAKDVVTAWHILARGEVPLVTDRNVKHGKELELMVGAPSVVAKGGAVEIVGWTNDTRGWNLARHTVTLKADGSVASTTETGKDLEESLKK